MKNDRGLARGDDEGRDIGIVECGALTIAMTEQGDIGIWKEADDDTKILGFGNTVAEAWDAMLEAREVGDED